MPFISATPKPPYYAVVFTSVNADVDHAEHVATNARMMELASRYEGFLGLESARNSEGRGIAVSYWRDMETIMTWARDPEHIIAKRKGGTSGTLTTCSASARSNANTDVRMRSDVPGARLRDPTAADEAGWRRLWSAYNDFYEAKVPEPVTAATWRRMLDPASPIIGRLAERDGAVCGFSICVLHEGTWTTDPICYLEDLFVEPSLRGGGVGRALVQDALDRARDRGCSRLYWHTRTDNAAARRVYDRFVAADDFVRYSIILR